MTTPLRAYLFLPYEDAPSVAAMHTALASVNVACIDTWASAIADAGIVDASTFDASVVEPDLTQSSDAIRDAGLAEETTIQTAHVLVVTAREGVSTLSSLQLGSLARYADTAGIPIVYVGEDSAFAHRPWVHQVANAAAAKAYLGAMTTALQPALTSPGATTYSIHLAVQSYFSPSPDDAGVSNADAGIVFGMRAPHAAGGNASTGASVGVVAGSALVVAVTLAVVLRWRRKPSARRGPGPS
jgi:hypothetical protein